MAARWLLKSIAYFGYVPLPPFYIAKKSVPNIPWPIGNEKTMNVGILGQ
jgi:hypothetical protein